MKIKAIEDFLDLDEKKIRKAGDEFEVSEERAAALIGGENLAKRPLCVAVSDKNPEKEKADASAEKTKKKRAVSNANK